MKQQPLAPLRQQQLTRWVGLFVLVALVLDLLMPALVSRLQAQSPDSIFLETCSAAGLAKRSAAMPSERVAGIAALAGGPDPGDNAPARTNHCVLCVVGQGWLPPADVKFAIHKPLVSEPLPAVVPPTPAAQRRPWATLPARAPPVLA